MNNDYGTDILYPILARFDDMDLAEMTKEEIFLVTKKRCETAASQVLCEALNALNDECYRGVPPGCRKEVYGFFEPYYKGNIAFLDAAQTYFANGIGDVFTMANIVDIKKEIKVETTKENMSLTAAEAASLTTKAIGDLETWGFAEEEFFAEITEEIMRTAKSGRYTVVIKNTTFNHTMVSKVTDRLIKDGFKIHRRSRQSPEFMVSWSV